jgi:hypothetical protein
VEPAVNAAEERLDLVASAAGAVTTFNIERVSHGVRRSQTLKLKAFEEPLENPAVSGRSLVGRHRILAAQSEASWRCLPPRMGHPGDPMSTGS